MRNKKIKEFLKSPSSNSKNLNINLKNSSFSNSYKSNNEIIEKFKNDINKKNEEISNLKQIMNELMEKINNLEEGKEKTQNKIKSYEKEIAKFVIENAELKRNILKKEISDKKYSIGKLNIKKTENGIGEYFSEGNEFKRIAGLINNINEKRTELNLLSLTKNTDLLNYKINEYNNKEIEIREYQEQLYLEKINQIHNILTLREEEKCKYNKNWVLIGEKYQLVSLIGKGGYSEIYKAYDIKNQKYVACKIHQLNVNWSNQMKDSYINHTVRENEILKLINHKNIVKHLDTIMIDNNSFCTVIELCNGKDLSSIIHERKKLSENEVKVITKQIVNALIYLSSLNKKIIHYDLKPQNILFHNNEIKISDFGVSKVIESDSNTNNIELTSQGIGTFYYLPPECFEMGNKIKINNKVDIWSLGIITYELIYGKKYIDVGYS
jgi:tousled-like kinase